MLAPVKRIREPHKVKKKSFDLSGNRTHDLWVRSTVTLLTELRGWTEKVGDNIYTSELIIFFTICVHSATRHNIHMYPYFIFAAIHHLKSFFLRDQGRLGNEGRPILLKVGTQSCYVDLRNMPKFQLQWTFLAEFWISAPQGSPEADFQGNSGHFSNIQLILDKNKTILVMPYS